MARLGTYCKLLEDKIAENADGLWLTCISPWNASEAIGRASCGAWVLIVGEGPGTLTLVEEAR